MIDEKLKNEIIEFVQKADRPVTLDEIKSNFKLEEVENLKSEINDFKELVSIPFFICWKGEYGDEGIEYYKMAILPRHNVLEFILNDIEQRLLTAQRELNIEELLQFLRDDIHEYFGLYEGKPDRLMEDILNDIYYKMRWSFSDIIIDDGSLVSLISADDRFYIDYRSAFDFYFIFIGLKEWKSYSIKKLLSDEEIIRSKAVSIIKKAGNNEISLKDLTFRLNTYSFAVPMPKPFKSDYIKDIIIKYPDSFIFHSINEKVSLNDIEQVDCLKKFDLKERWLFDAGYIAPYKKSDITGIVGIKYIGESFPVSEFREYIKLRPYIYTFKTVDFPRVISKFYNNGLQETGVLDRSGVEKLLKKIMPEINDLNWFKENFEIYYLLEGAESLDSTYKEQIKKLIPIFNVYDNPGNIFELTVKDMIKEVDGK